MNRQPQQCKQCGAEIYFDGICLTCRSDNERTRILGLSQIEINTMIDEICAEIKENGKLDHCASLFRKLVNYRDIDTTQIAKLSFEKELFHPCEIYKNAPSSVIKAMIHLVKKDATNSHMAGQLLLCLAVYGGDEVFQTFLELERNPRLWRKELYVNPSVYATYGGWTYDSEEKYRETNFNKCYPMVKGTPQEKLLSPVKIGTKTDEVCTHCGCQMVNIIEIDGRDSRLDYLGIDGVIKAKCCPNCSGYFDGTFCKYTIDGESEMILENDSLEENYFEESEIDALTSNTYVLAQSSVPLRYAADWEGDSSVGGFAFWIQDCEIKICPECKKPMKYLAQIQWDRVISDTEGNAYIEICKDCHIMVVLHQQT